ncbi:MAG TPA: hypothetical protein H9714_06510 [Candidatus Flavonifractor intestinipullorum]|uniref:Uncharacterized protein n=1 Tax=Candidatus Flavonifractor intestinipullorum TaxID=2838587 RepID=A0A9D2MB87_9FIRM|nr:hypothetical protein [Candidatus Flavonifractor intestinipullorum]
MTILVGALSAFAKWLFQALKSAPQDSAPKSHPSSKRTLHQQFYRSLIALVLFLVIGLSVPASVPLSLFGAIRVLCLFAAGYSFLFAVGAFDAAMSLYPGDDAREDRPSKDQAKRS